MLLYDQGILFERGPIVAFVASRSKPCEAVFCGVGQVSDIAQLESADTEPLGEICEPLLKPLLRPRLHEIEGNQHSPPSLLDLLTLDLSQGESS